MIGGRASHVKLSAVQEARTVMRQSIVVEAVDKSFLDLSGAAGRLPHQLDDFLVEHGRLAAPPIREAEVLHALES